ncbi:MAG: hypothetical protein LCH84_01355 [Gemmatimonadetes bacterium]|nr:hypothetical protein [Gemmatimonadota bacterium]
MPPLNGSSQPIPLGQGYRIRAPGTFGTADLRTRTGVGVSRSVTVAGERPALDRALAAEEMEDRATIDLSVSRRQPAAAGALRAPGVSDAIELEVPAPQPGFEAVVIAVDESGGISWHLPLTNDGSIATPVTRANESVRRFRIPAAPAPRPPATGAAVNRSIFGSIGRKILKVLVYPITDRLVGKAVDLFAGKWEAKRRPYRLRTMSPADYTQENVAALVKGTSDFDSTFARLRGGRSLLFVHGTFSTAHSAFAGLEPADVQALSQAYDGRLWAFDHFTLSHAPLANVEELVRQLPDGDTLEVDIVCHSRGGLVAREIVERGALNGAAGRLKVGKVVFVGAANAGTILTEPDHMVHMIDRFTSAIDLLPEGPATYVLEGIITAIKVIGHGGLQSLDGLASMNPAGSYLAQLNAASQGSATYLGITADFEPSGTAFSALTLKNALMDRIFGETANDLVVPTDGVFTGGGPCFPIAGDALLSLPASAGVVHTTYFSAPAVRQQLRAWLTGQ